MAETNCRAAELVANALRTDEDFYTMDDLLGELEMPEEFEPDPRIRVQRASDEINYYARDCAYHEGVERPPLGFGFPNAMTADFDVRLQTLPRLVVQRHRRYPSEDISICDPQMASDGTSLPEWNINDPKQGNIIRALVASDPNRLHVLRGDYTHTDLARRVWGGNILTHCNVNISADCDPIATPPRGWNDRAVWGFFTASVGEFLVYQTICGPCFFKLWPMEDGTDFYDYDPSREPDGNKSWWRADSRRRVFG